MAGSTEPERRGFIRIAESLPVQYRFVATGKGKGTDQTFSGQTRNISGSGMLLYGPLPDTSWVKELLSCKSLLAVSIRLPGKGGPVKAVARAAWIDVDLKGTPPLCEMGLTFQEITQQDEQRLLEFIISSLI